jgi:hypothetical protein
MLPLSSVLSKRKPSQGVTSYARVNSQMCFEFLGIQITWLVKSKHPKQSLFVYKSETDHDLIYITGIKVDVALNLIRNLVGILIRTYTGLFENRN